MKLQTSHLWACLFLFVVTLHTGKSLGDEDQIAAEIATLKTGYGVEIVTDFDPLTHFPPQLLGAPHNMVGRRSLPADIARAFPYIKSFLQLHPPAAIKANLSKIYLVSDLGFDGMKMVTSTTDGSNLYLCVNYPYDSTGKADFTRACQTMFTKSLFDKRWFPSDKWNAINDKSFRYAADQEEFRKRNSGSTAYLTKTDLLEEGFLVDFSKCSMEDDFCMISHWLFFQRESLEEFLPHYPKLRAKVKLAVDFYKGIDAGYSTRLEASIVRVPKGDKIENGVGFENKIGPMLPIELPPKTESALAKTARYGDPPRQVLLGWLVSSTTDRKWKYVYIKDGSNRLFLLDKFGDLISGPMEKAK